jgi:hypothetical protein
MSIKVIKSEGFGSGLHVSHDEYHNAWDEGHHVLNETEGKLFEHPQGEKLGEVMSEWTVCPISNGTCQDMVMAEMVAVHPDKPPQSVSVYLCPLGISGNGESCPLNK